MASPSLGLAAADGTHALSMPRRRMLFPFFFVFVFGLGSGQRRSALSRRARPAAAAGMEAYREAKGRLFEALTDPTRQRAVINADDAEAEFFAKKARHAAPRRATPRHADPVSIMLSYPYLSLFN